MKKVLRFLWAMIQIAGMVGLAALVISAGESRFETTVLCSLVLIYAAVHSYGLIERNAKLFIAYRTHYMLVEIASAVRHPSITNFQATLREQEQDQSQYERKNLHVFIGLALVGIMAVLGILATAL